MSYIQKCYNGIQGGVSSFVVLEVDWCFHKDCHTHTLYLKHIQFIITFELLTQMFNF